MIRTKTNPTGSQILSSGYDPANIVYRVCAYSGTTAYIPMVNSSTDVIDWGDGTTETATSGTTGTYSHTYSDGVEYHIVQISGGTATTIAGTTQYKVSVVDIINIPSTITAFGSGSFRGIASITPPLETVDLSNYGGIYLSSYLFIYCSHLRSVKFPTSGILTSLGPSSFGYCTSLETVAIPEGVSLWAIQTKSTFNRSGLKHVSIPSTFPSIMSNPFTTCPIETITFPNGHSSLVVENGYLCNSSTNTVLCATTSATTFPTWCTDLGKGCLYYNQTITSVTIPSYITYVGSIMFTGSTIQSLTIESSDTQFYSGIWHGTPTNLVEVHFNGSGFQSHMCYGMTYLTTLYLTTNFNSLEYASSSTINSDIFYGCSNFSTIVYNGTRSQWNATSALVSIFGTLASDGSLSGGNYTNTVLTVDYNRMSYVIAASVNDSSMGTVSGAGTYDEGTSVTLTATPNSGYRFVSWSDGVATATRTITVSANTTYTATFEIDVGYTVTFSPSTTGSTSGMSISDLFTHYNITLTYADGSTETASSYKTYRCVVSLSVGSPQKWTDSNEGDEFLNIIGNTTSTMYCSQEYASSTLDINPLTEPLTVNFQYYAAACLTKNTLITMADGTMKYINEIRPGDKVLAYNTDTETLSYDTVRYCDGTLERYASKYEIYMFSNGTEIEVVNDHRFYNVEDNKLKLMSKWEIGEHSLDLDGNEIELVKHIQIDKPTKFYAIFGDWHNYIANGLISGDQLVKYPFFQSKVNGGN